MTERCTLRRPTVDGDVRPVEAMATSCGQASANCEKQQNIGDDGKTTKRPAIVCVKSTQHAHHDDVLYSRAVGGVLRIGVPVHATKNVGDLWVSRNVTQWRQCPRTITTAGRYTHTGRHTHTHTRIHHRPILHPLQATPHKRASRHTCLHAAHTATNDGVQLWNFQHVQ